MGPTPLRCKLQEDSDKVISYRFVVSGLTGPQVVGVTHRCGAAACGTGIVARSQFRCDYRGAAPKCFRKRTALFDAGSRDFDTEV